jgi:hypothetical protein
MISEVTEAQLSRLALDKDRPLVICDVDDVVVHFLKGFEDYIGGLGLWLDAASFALHGNVRWHDGGHAAEDHHVTELIDTFFRERTRTMEPIDGAIESLLDVADVAQVVMLTNLPHSSGDCRRANLQDHGLVFPVVTNSGPKGPAIRHLAERTGRPVIFIDDSPAFIASAHQHAPEVQLVHFLHDARFARHVRRMDYVALRSDHWDEVRAFVLDLLKG